MNEDLTRMHMVPHLAQVIGNALELAFVAEIEPAELVEAMRYVLPPAVGELRENDEKCAFCAEFAKRLGELMR